MKMMKEALGCNRDGTQKVNKVMSRDNMLDRLSVGESPSKVRKWMTGLTDDCPMCEWIKDELDKAINWAIQRKCCKRVRCQWMSKTKNKKQKKITKGGCKESPCKGSMDYGFTGVFLSASTARTTNKRNRVNRSKKQLNTRRTPGAASL